MSDKTEELGLPNQDEALLGWRAWRVQKLVVARDTEQHTHTVTYRLRSLYERYAEPEEWMPHRAPHAKCRDSTRKTPPHHQPDVPYERCSCGYSAYRTLDDLLRDIGGRSFDKIVIGEVGVWGRVLVGSSELRSTFAHPVSAYLVRNWWSWDEDAPLVAESLLRYGIPSKDLHSKQLPT